MEAALVMPRSLDLLCRRRARLSAAPHPAMAAAMIAVNGVETFVHS
jgi:hypothetical protein